MSEVKGTLLGIVLAISMFSIVFAIVQVAMNKSANDVSQRISDASNLEPEIEANELYTVSFHL